MKRTLRPWLSVLSLLLVAAASALAAELPDTGQSTCYSGDAADIVGPANPGSVAADSGIYPRQDCRFGADPAALAGATVKIGGGTKGFDYTRIANNGTSLSANAALGAGPADWGCTRDNVTGLIWEVKSDQPGNLRYFGYSYTWYDTNTATNGGVAGSAGANTCGGTVGALCNTRAFVIAMNGAAACTYTDWRLPTLRELQSLVNADGTIPSLDGTFFPNPPAAPFWTSATYSKDVGNAWTIDFGDGSSNSDDKVRPNPVRLVRGVSF